MYLEGSDQHRGWFHSSLLQSCGTRGEAPFETILSHGFVVDGKGLKMSKSLGNVISPDDILKKYGADILRIWVAASNYSEDLRIDYTILEQHADAYRKIRNTFRYILGNLRDEFSENDFNKINYNELCELDKLMLHKIYLLNNNYQKNFKSYNFHLLYKDLLNFCTVDLSSFYFDIRKDSLYCDDLKSKRRKDCLQILNVLLDCLLKWFAPILSFTTEEIFKLINKKLNESIHLEKFVTIPENWKNENLAKKWKEILNVREIANSSIELKRADKLIGSSLEAEIIIELNKEKYDLLKDYDFAEICITSNAELKLNQDIKANTNVITKKAIGEKCPVCWKIFDKKCERHNCGFDGKKK